MSRRPRYVNQDKQQQQFANDSSAFTKLFSDDNVQNAALENQQPQLNELPPSVIPPPPAVSISAQPNTSITVPPPPIQQKPIDNQIIHKSNNQSFDFTTNIAQVSDNQQIFSDQIIEPAYNAQQDMKQQILQQNNFNNSENNINNDHNNINLNQLENQQSNFNQNQQQINNNQPPQLLNNETHQDTIEEVPMVGLTDLRSSFSHIEIQGNPFRPYRAKFEMSANDTDFSVENRYFSNAASVSDYPLKKPQNDAEYAEDRDASQQSFKNEANCSNCANLQSTLQQIENSLQQKVQEIQYYETENQTLEEQITGLQEIIEGQKYQLVETNQQNQQNQEILQKQQQNDNNQEVQQMQIQLELQKVEFDQISEQLVMQKDDFQKEQSKMNANLQIAQQQIQQLLSQNDGLALSKNELEKRIQENQNQLNQMQLQLQSLIQQIDSQKVVESTLKAKIAEYEVQQLNRLNEAENQNNQIIQYQEQLREIQEIQQQNELKLQNQNQELVNEKELQNEMKQQIQQLRKSIFQNQQISSQTKSSIKRNKRTFSFLGKQEIQFDQIKNLNDQNKFNEIVVFLDEQIKQEVSEMEILNQNNINQKVTVQQVQKKKEIKKDSKWSGSSQSNDEESSDNKNDQQAEQEQNLQGLTQELPCMRLLLLEALKFRLLYCNQCLIPDGSFEDNKQSYKQGSQLIQLLLVEYFDQFANNYNRQSTKQYQHIQQVQMYLLSNQHQKAFEICLQQQDYQLCYFLITNFKSQFQEYKQLIEALNQETLFQVNSVLDIQLLQAEQTKFNNPFIKLGFELSKFVCGQNSFEQFSEQILDILRSCQENPNEEYDYLKQIILVLVGAPLVYSTSFEYIDINDNSTLTTSLINSQNNELVNLNQMTTKLLNILQKQYKTPSIDQLRYSEIYEYSFYLFNENLPKHRKSQPSLKQIEYDRIIKFYNFQEKDDLFKLKDCKQKTFSKLLIKLPFFVHLTVFRTALCAFAQKHFPNQVILLEQTQIYLQNSKDQLHFILLFNEDAELENEDESQIFAIQIAELPFRLSNFCVVFPNTPLSRRNFAELFKQVAGFALELQLSLQQKQIKLNVQCDRKTSDLGDIKKSTKNDQRKSTTDNDSNKELIEENKQLQFLSQQLQQQLQDQLQQQLQESQQQLQNRQNQLMNQLHQEQIQLKDVETQTIILENPIEIKQIEQYPEQYQKRHLREDSAPEPRHNQTQSNVHTPRLISENNDINHNIVSLPSVQQVAKPTSQNIFTKTEQSSDGLMDSKALFPVFSNEKNLLLNRIERMPTTDFLQIHKNISKKKPEISKINFPRKFENKDETNVKSEVFNPIEIKPIFLEVKQDQQNSQNQIQNEIQNEIPFINVQEQISLIPIISSIPIINEIKPEFQQNNNFNNNFNDNFNNNFNIQQIQQNEESDLNAPPVDNYENEEIQQKKAFFKKKKKEFKEPEFKVNLKKVKKNSRVFSTVFNKWVELDEKGNEIAPVEEIVPPPPPSAPNVDFSVPESTTSQQSHSKKGRYVSALK